MAGRGIIVLHGMLSLLIDLVYFVALVYMFCYVEALPFSSRRKKYLVVGGTGVIVAVNLLIFFLFPDVVIGEIALLTQTIPSMVICWIASRHKDARFLFVFCSLDVIAFMLMLIVNGVSAVLPFNEIAYSITNLLLVFLYLCVIHQYGTSLRRIMEMVEKIWNKLSVFVLLFYVYSYFLILYPEPWKDRPEYAPVIIGYAILILYCFYIIMWMLIGKERIQRLERKEYEMKLQLERQNSRVLMHKIQPHFIYNVLMSIRYFVKKDSQVAYDMIYDFSNYLRFNVEQLENVDRILWSEELEHIQVYVRIEKMRFKERLNIVYAIGEEDFLIPPLCVEPLVENAVKHGVMQKMSGGTVWIRSRTTETGHEIVIEDNGVGFDVESLGQEKSVGFDYIRARLAMTEGASMQIESTPGEGTRVRLTFAKDKEEESDESDTCG